MIFQQLLGVLPWSMCAAFSVALVALVIPKLWVLNVNADLWTWSWIGGCAGAGLLTALVWTSVIRCRPLQAAMEIDRRFGLKERVSSSLALNSNELETNAGRALMNDTLRHIERIDVGERFRIAVNWRSLLPLLTVLTAIGVLFIPNAVPNQTATAKESQLNAEKQIQEANKQLKKRIEEQRKKAEEAGLKDAEVLFKNVKSQLDALNRSGASDRKRALVRLNDLKKGLEERRQQLGDPVQMRKHLDQLKDIKQGPADKAVKAMKDGNFKQALGEIKKLNKLVQNGNLGDEQRKQLGDQLEQMANKLNNVAQAHEQAKRDVEQQIQQAERAGDLAKAGQLQQQFDQLRQQDRRMDRLQQMASKLSECSQCLKPGMGRALTKDQLAQAGQALDDIASQLQEMQLELDELDSLDAAMDQIAQAKNAMNCDQCGGAGCGACAGMFDRGQFGQMPGFGLGEGQGQGERPEQATDTGHYLSKVGAAPKKGEAIRVGDADGANVAGRTKESVKQEIESSLSQDPDPLTNVRLPRAQRDHTKEYFERLREGR